MRVYSFLTQRPGERKGTQGILGARFPQRVQNPLLDEIKSTKGTHSHEAFFNAFSAFEFPAAGDYNPWRGILHALPLCIALFTFLSIFSTAPLLAQGVDPSAVYVTTQDFTSLRAGPGRAFERIAVIPPATTLHAVGRTTDNRWIQVEYENQRGWVATWLLVWTGDVLTLKLDGLDPLPFARRISVIMTANRDAPYYASYESGVRLGLIPKDTRVEMTGRFGSGRTIWLQLEKDGQYVWSGAWNYNIRGDYLSLPDAASIYPYGRLLGKLNTGISNTQNNFSDIAFIWRSLASGQSVSCDDIPRPARVIEFSPDDVASATLLMPAVSAVQSAINHTNTAIQMFADVCALEGADRYLTPEQINAALAEVDAAARDFVLAESLFEPLTRRDPSVGN